MNTPRTAAQIWDYLVDEAGEDEVEAAAAMSVEEAEAYLASEGYDIAEERAKGEAFLADILREDAAEVLHPHGDKPPRP